MSTGARRPTRAEVAREKARAARATQQAAARRRRATIVTTVAVVVLLLAGGIGYLASRQTGTTGTTNAATPAGAVDGGLALRRGKADAPVTLVLYEDFRCPACEGFETQFGPTVRQLVAAGTLKVDYHIASFIDGNVGGSGSKTAANAAACAAQAGRFPQFHDVLYAHQPAETDDGFGSADKVLALAAQVPGLRSATFDSCVRDGSFAGWVTRVQSEFDRRWNGQVSTPSILLQGRELVSPVTRGGTAPELASPQAFRAAVEAAATK